MSSPPTFDWAALGAPRKGPIGRAPLHVGRLYGAPCALLCTARQGSAAPYGCPSADGVKRDVADHLVMPRQQST